jgi:hypothetical protein
MGAAPFERSASQADRRKKLEPTAPFSAYRRAAVIARTSFHAEPDVTLPRRRTPRLGKYLDRDEKLATSAPAFPAKAGTHASSAPNFSSNALVYQRPTSSCGGTIDPGLRRGRRVDRLPKDSRRADVARGGLRPPLQFLRLSTRRLGELLGPSRAARGATRADLRIGGGRLRTRRSRRHGEVTTRHAG